MARKPVCVIFSDSHLALGAWVSRPEIQGDAFYSFRQIVGYAVENGLPLIGAGDLLDTNRPSPAVAHFLREQCDLLQGAEIPFYYVLGQHDFSDPTWFAAVSPHPILLDRLGSFYPLCLGGRKGLRVYGLSFRREGDLQEELSRIPKDTDVLVCHQVWENFMGGVAVCEGALEQVPHVKAVFTGDYHRTMQLTLGNAQARRMTVYSPGSTCMQSIDEPVEKSFYLLYDDLSVDTIPLKTRPVIETSVIDEGHLDRLCASIGTQVDETRNDMIKRGWEESVAHPLVWVHYHTDIDNVVTHLRRNVPNQYLFLDPIQVETPARAQKRENRARVKARGLLGAIETLTEEDPRLKQVCLRLASSSDPGTELQAIKTEFFSEKVKKK